MPPAEALFGCANACSIVYVVEDRLDLCPVSLPYEPSIDPFEMLSSNYFNSHNLNDVNSLALSGSQTRSRILNNDQLFSKSKGKHLVELTQLDPDISENPRIFAFSDASQLSEHFRSRERNLLHRSHVMEI